MTVLHDNESNSSTALKPSKSDVKFKLSNVHKIIGLIILIIGFTASVVFGATDLEKDMKDYTDKSVTQVKKEIKKETEDNYVKKYEFGKIEAHLEHQQKTVDEIKKEQKETSKKLDKLYDHLINRNNHSN